MSEHAWVHENLDAYVTGAMSPDECSRIERHLATCDDCTQAGAEMASMEQLLQGVCTRVRPDVGLEDRAIHRLRLAKAPRPNRLRFVLAAAAVVVLGLIGGAVQMLAMEGKLPGMANEYVLEGRSYSGLIQGTTYHGRNSPDALNGVPGDTVKKHSAGEFEGLPDMANYGTFKALDELSSERVLADKEQLDRNIKPGWTQPPLPKESTTMLDKHIARDGPANFYGEGLIARDKDEKDAKERTFYALRVQQEKARDNAEDTKLKANLDDFVRPDIDMAKATKDIEDRIAGSRGIMPGPTTPPAGIGVGGGFGGGGLGGKKDGGMPGPGFFYQPPSAIVGGPKGPGQPSTTSGSMPASYLPTLPPPVTPSSPAHAKETPRADEPKLVQNKDDKKPADTAQQKEPAPTGRMIIRTGEMEFETDSFDNAVDMITKLITGVKGGFIATVNSDKLANGKTKGSVIVRMPPQLLDKFIYDLRKELSKTSELKNQRLGSLDVTKQYTDIESRLRAARALEERLINIIKTGKGDIKELVAAEKELGVWRTKIEEMEGEIRYYANQVSLSTLTITLVEKEIAAPTSIVVTETVTIRLEVDEVAKAHQTAMKAIEDLKGRITRSELKQHTAGQFLSILSAEIPPAKKEAFITQLKTLGLVSDFQENQRQHTEGGVGKAPELKPKQGDVHFDITMHNTANIRPRLSTDMKVATTDVPGAYAKLLAAITKVKGQVRDGKLNEQDKLNITATLDFNVPTAEKPGIDKLLDEIGPMLERVNIQAPVSELSTDRKFGYTLLLRDFASIPPRQAQGQIVATLDVPASYARLQDAVAKAKGQISDAKLNEADKFNVSASLDFTIPTDEKPGIEKLLAELGTQLSRTNMQAPMHQLTTAKKFGYSIALRDFASIPPSKSVQLTAATLDVPGSYAKLQAAIAEAKGQIVDAKLNEQDKFNITAQIEFSVPTDDKAAIDKLLADPATVTILSRNNVQAPMNQLSIAKKFGYSIVLRDFANILPSHAADIKVATSDVPGNYAKLVDAIVKAKGQIRVAKLNEQDKLNISAQLDFTVPTADKPALDKLLAQVGTMLSRNNVQAPVSELTTDKKFGYSLVLRDIATIPARESFNVALAAVDVPTAFRDLQDAVTAAKGMVTLAETIEDSKTRIEAKFNFDVPAAQRQAIESLFGKVGAVLGRTSNQVPVNELATDQKVGYRLILRNVAAIAPREIISVKQETQNLDARMAELSEIVVAATGRVLDSPVDRQENGQAVGVMTFEVPFASRDVLLKQIKGSRDFVTQKTVRNPQVPVNELTTAHIVVTLAVNPFVTNDETLGSYVRASFYMSFRVFSVCVMLIILGLSAVLPWVLVVWFAYKMYCKIAGVRSAAPIAAEPPPPSPA